MSSITEITTRIASIGAESDRVASSLDYEAGEISSVMQRLQLTFGDQQPGQEAVLTLTRALSATLAAGAALRNEKAHGIDFVSKILS